MVQVREIMTSEMVTMSPQTTVREAMELLAMHHVSGAPVLAGGKLVGVVSASDLMAFAGSLSGVPTERDMHAEWVETDDVPLEVELRTDEGPAGAFFSDLWEDAGADLSTRFDNVASPEWNSLEEHDVSELMTRLPVIALPPDATAEDAADLMRDARVHRVLIMEGEELLGIVTSFDIARAVADHRFTIRKYVFNHDERFVDGRSDVYPSSDSA